MYGHAKGLRVKYFNDSQTEGGVEDRLNDFFREYPELQIIDIKYFNGYAVINEDQMDTYGRESALVVYRVK